MCALAVSQVDFLSHATQVLMDIKRGLKWSFAFLYFRPDDGQDQA